MGVLKKIKNAIVYRLTEKPKCYVHVDEPKTLQDLRQIQYNNWCKVKGVYSGSYLPENPDTLKRKGWNETTSAKIRGNDQREFTRKSSGQVVRHDNEATKRGKPEAAHYHWYNGNSQREANKKEKPFIDRCGKPCTKKDDGHHILPWDKKYVKRGK